MILDVKMPVLDGIAAAEQIAGQRIAPVVILTAFSQRDLVERARDAGAMAYLVKPFTPADLVPAIEMAVSRFAELSAARGGGRRPRRAARDPQGASSAPRECSRSSSASSEPEAFRWIQKTAMDLRLSMREVADGVVEHGPGLRAGRAPTVGSVRRPDLPCRRVTDRHRFRLAARRVCFLDHIRGVRSGAVTVTTASAAARP